MKYFDIAGKLAARRGPLLLMVMLVAACGPSLESLEQRVQSPRPCNSEEECRALEERAAKYLRECQQQDPYRGSQLEGRSLGYSCDRESRVYRLVAAAHERVVKPRDATERAHSEPRPAVTARPDRAARGDQSSALSSLEQVKAWWATCLKARTRPGGACEDSSSCRDECRKNATPMVEKALYESLGLEACRTVTNPPDYESKCRLVIDYLEGRTGFEPAAGIKYQSMAVPPREGPTWHYPSWPAGPAAPLKGKALLALLEARCSSVRVGSSSCDELAWVLSKGGFNGGFSDNFYDLSSDERAGATATLTQAQARLDEARWTELNTSGSLERCRKPSTSRDCDPVDGYVKSFPQGRHQAEATNVMRATEQRRKDLAAQEERQAKAQAEAVARYRASSEGQAAERRARCHSECRNARDTCTIRPGCGVGDDCGCLERYHQCQATCP